MYRMTRSCAPTEAVLAEAEAIVADRPGRPGTTTIFTEKPPVGIVGSLSSSVAGKIDDEAQKLIRAEMWIRTDAGAARHLRQRVNDDGLTTASGSLSALIDRLSGLDY